MEENHVTDWDKAKLVDREAQEQTRLTRCTLDQEDTDVHESGRRILPTQLHMGPGDFPGHVLHRAVNNQQDVIEISNGHRNVIR